MKNFVTTLITIGFLFNYAIAQETSSVFETGETIGFKLKLGIFTVGEAQMYIDPHTYNINKKRCYGLKIKGKTTGLVSWISDVDNFYQSYVDVNSLQPQQFYMNINEGSYKKKQSIQFFQDKKYLSTEHRNHKTGKLDKTTVTLVQDPMHDIISGMYAFRTIDFSKHNKGDIIEMKGVFEEKVYNLKIKFLGTETIGTAIGKKKAWVFQPIMPKNEVFDEGKSITFWVSTDKNKIPLKIKAKLVVGSAKVEIANYSLGKKLFETPKSLPSKLKLATINK